MLVYNITTNVQPAVHDAWLNWLKQKHIPEIMATGLFERYNLMKILDTDDAEGHTYALQLFCISRANYENYLRNHAPELRENTFKTWGDAVISFRTTMEVIN